MRHLYALLTLVVAVVAQQAYARLVVPLIEPEFRTRQDNDPLPIRTEGVVQRDAMLPWFRPGDWELDPLNKLLDTPDGILILRNYRNQPDGTVEIHPCTMVFLPREEPGADRKAQATIMQAPQGAVLRLDAPLDLKTGKMGRLLGGRLNGEVTIRSDHREPGPEDDLFIRTHDVEMNGARLITDAEVNFRLGGHHGHGRRLRIELAPSSKASRAGISFSGIKTLELLERVWMHVDMGKGLLRGPHSAPTAPPANSSKPAQEPVEIACRGRFRYDAEGRSATFYEQVQVTRLVAQGARSESDQLHGDVLQLFFKAPGAAAKGSSKAGMGKLEFERLMAVGTPVVVLSPSRQMEARGGTLEWREQDSKIRLHSVSAEVPGATTPKRSGSPPPAVMIQGGSEIQAGELECEMGADGSLTKAHALGAGQMRADRTQPGGKSEPITARWTRSLRLAPEGELQLLSLAGNAEVSLAESGSLRGEEIYVWFLERKRPAGAAPAAGPVDPLGRGGSSLEPQKLAARERVHLEASGMTADVDELQAWFDHRAVPAALQPPPARPGAAQPAPRVTVRREIIPVAFANGPGDPAEAVASDAPAGLAPVTPYPTTDYPAATPPAAPLPAGAPAGLVPGAPLGIEGPVQRKFQVRGNLLRARILVMGKVSSIGELWLEGQMQIDEREAQGSPVSLKGDTLHAIEDDPRGATVRITGQPASVVGEGLTLTGGVINLHRSANQMWVEGPGRLTLPARAERGEFASAPAAPLEVRWEGGMTFDGFAGRFTEGVVAQLDTRALRTADLRVKLTERVEFAKKATGKPQVETVACPGEFNMSGKTLKNGAVVSTDAMEAKNLALNQLSGAVTAQGPGRIVQVRQGREERLAGPGRQPKPAQPAQPKPEDKNQLMYLQVRFQGELTGNLHAKETTFIDQVESLYGPVQNWDEVLSADELRPEDLWLACQRLTVQQSPTQGAQSSELEATTDVRVRGQQYQAWGGRLTYAEAKDLLILEGDNRTDAQLWRQLKLGGEVDRLNAKKIYFWPATNHVKFEGVGGADLGGLSK